MMQTHDGAELCFPQLNTSCRKPTDRSKAVVLNLLVSLVSVLTVALNVLVIFSISYFRQLHTNTNTLLLSLAVSDFLVGLVAMPGKMLRQTGCWSLGEIMCSVFKYLTCVTLCASIANMVLISVDRYVAICDPLHYPTRVTERRLKLCVCVCWLGSVFYSGIYFKDELTEPGKTNSCYGQCVFNIDYIVGAVDMVVSFICPITLIIVLHIRVFVVAVSQARAMRSHITAVTLQRSVTVTTKSELKAARTLGVVVAVFLMSYCPYYCVSLVGENLVNRSAASFVTYLFYCNSCLNPLIYALFYPWFRKTIKLIVTLQILQPGSRETNVL